MEGRGLQRELKRSIGQVVIFYNKGWRIYVDSLLECLRNTENKLAALLRVHSNSPAPTILHSGLPSAGTQAEPENGVLSLRTVLPRIAFVSIVPPVRAASIF
jgi:hypothetical protein